jgi:membrane protein DedA with SNARE-associated domain
LEEVILIGQMIDHIIFNWGYLGVFLLVGAESFGIPAPGESALIAAAVVSAKGDLSIALLLGAAIAGGIIGDNIGFWVGRELGFRLLCRYGSYIGMPPQRMKLLQYLFLRYGRRIVFVGRFVMILRAWEAFLAGADWMPWMRFATINAAAVALWACVWGLNAYALGHAEVRVIEWISAAVSVVLIGLMFSFYVYFRRHESELESEADKALPGPLRSRRDKADALQRG